MGTSFCLKHYLFVLIPGKIELKVCPVLYVLCQLCPQAAEAVELVIYLSEPCHVCQLVLTISHGADDLTCPSTVNVKTGRHLEDLKLVVQVDSLVPSLLLYHVDTCMLASSTG